MILKNARGKPSTTKLKKIIFGLAVFISATIISGVSAYGYSYACNSDCGEGTCSCSGGNNTCYIPHLGDNSLAEVETGSCSGHDWIMSTRNEGWITEKSKIPSNVLNGEGNKKGGNAGILSDNHDPNEAAILDKLEGTSCTDDGYKIKYARCSLCGWHVYRVKVIKADGKHNWSGWKDNGDGGHSKTCQNSYHDEDRGDGAKTVTEAHNSNNISGGTFIGPYSSTTAAAYGTVDYFNHHTTGATKSCSVCGHVMGTDQTVSAPHDWYGDNEGTPGYYNAKDTNLIGVTGGLWHYGVNTTYYPNIYHAKYCTTCSGGGWAVYNNLFHTYGTPGMWQFMWETERWFMQRIRGKVWYLIRLGQGALFSMRDRIGKFYFLFDK